MTAGASATAASATADRAAGVEIHSLGCRLNIAESERIRALLAGERDLVVVNSCAVTAEAVRHTRQAIRKARRARPHARLLVTGCAAEIEHAQLSAMPEVDGLVPNAEKLDPRHYAPSGVNVGKSCELPRPGEAPVPSAVNFSAGWDLPQPRTAPDSTRPLPPQGLTEHTRAFVGVQNGCDHACTFCVIPQGRGASRSIPIPHVMREIEHHLEQGAPEIVLTGVDVTSWGHDLPGTPKLGALVRAVLGAFNGLERLRLSSLDGIEIDGELFELLAAEPRLMPHLHLSLQHGHDLILKRMKRRHLRRHALALVERLRDRRPDIAIGADLIAGFPTEDEAMHAANRSIIGELGIVHGHIFPYSPRPDTPAARMPQVDRPVIRRRAAELRAEVAAVRERWLGTFIGKPAAVLAEADGTGYSESFARIAVPAGTAPGTILSVTPTRIEAGVLQ